MALTAEPNPEPLTFSGWGKRDRGYRLLDLNAEDIEQLKLPVPAFNISKDLETWLYLKETLRQGRLYRSLLRVNPFTEEERTNHGTLGAGLRIGVR